MKYVYLFNEGNKDMKELLGGKGANLAEMTKLGLPVPFGFTITCEACNDYYEHNHEIKDEIIKEIWDNIKILENVTGKEFGNPDKPLLLSIRSGARSSMPGMMDSIHFIGLNEEIVKAYALKNENLRFIYDTYRRFMQSYIDIAENLDFSFENYFEELKKELNVLNDSDLTVDNFQYIIKKYHDKYYELTSKTFSNDYRSQLINAIKGVFESWNKNKAKSYRKINNIPDNWGTAVNVQENVFGNMNDNSATGVVFSRNPVNGENKLFGEFLINAQGDDVVAGIRTPLNINKLAIIMPKCYDELCLIAKKLENHFKDVQDMEFTIENGKLYMLQTRNAKRSLNAAAKIAYDLVKEGIIDKNEAIMRIDPNSLSEVLHPSFDTEVLASLNPISKGLAASPGCASGKIYFSAEKAILNSKNEKVILVRDETTPEDIEGMHVSVGLLTMRGGMTSHAAVVARSMGVCCISSCENLVINLKENKCIINNKEYYEGDFLSLDGNNGLVYEGNIPTLDFQLSDEFKQILLWAETVSKIKVRANADTAFDAKLAMDFRAEGIGLCRSEHMFFAKDRILKMRKMILANNDVVRQDALKDLELYQKNDFIKMYEVIKERPMTVRLLDPPLHEFLPKNDNEIELLAKEMNLSIKEVKDKIMSLKEFNPMMGHRGCRLLISYPEIVQMQTRALIEAAIKVNVESNINIKPEIMLPLINDKNEFIYLKKIIVNEINKLESSYNIHIDYQIGTMIELPRAAIMAHELALYADFFSFGTNDLTQMTYGFSRDDAEKFLNSYYDNHIYHKDPFVSLDQEGVGKLIVLAKNLANKVKPNMEMGVCGEQGADPESIKFFIDNNLNYVSCSVYRIIGAKIAAAQASLVD